MGSQKATGNCAKHDDDAVEMNDKFIPKNIKGNSIGGHCSLLPLIFSLLHLPEKFMALFADSPNALKGGDIGEQRD